jgi:hypothetical protein
VSRWDTGEVGPRASKGDGADHNEHNTTRNPKDLSGTPCWSLHYSRCRLCFTGDSLVHVISLFGLQRRHLCVVGNSSALPFTLRRVKGNGR